MMEYPDILKFWIRGSRENPIGVIETISSRIGLPISAMGVYMNDFEDSNILWHPFMDEISGAIEVMNVSSNSVYGQWLMAAWPEIQPEDILRPKIVTLVIKGKERRTNCKECKLYEYCHSLHRFNSLAALYPFPFTPCVQDVEVWDSEASAKECYGI